MRDKYLMCPYSITSSFPCCSDVKKQFFQKRIKGRGYCDMGTSVISEFYTPLVPKGHDFLQTIGSLAQARQDGTATCEAKGDGTD